MSALAGIYYKDRRPVSQSIVETLCIGNTTYGPDNFGVFIDAGVASLTFALDCNALDQSERQPIVCVDGSVLAWDGRLDNRDDFIIRSHPLSRDALSDARLIATALQRSVDETLQEAVGDWSLAYWRPCDREVILARDYAGNRPLYYLDHQNYVVWSTALDAIIEIAGLHADISDTYFAHQLTFGAPAHYTHYRNVFRVPAGHMLRIVDGRVFAPIYIGGLRAISVRHSNRLGYEEHYRALFVDAVRVRLRSNKTVAAELSGGYDSSSVTCVASALIRSGTVDAPQLMPVSVVAPGNPDADDSQYISAVERFCDITAVRVSFERQKAMLSLGPLHGEPRHVSHAHLGQVVEKGCRTILTGEFGDDVTAPTPIMDLLRAHLRSGRMSAFLTDSFVACRLRQQPLVALWAQVVRAMFDSPARISRRRRAARLRALRSGKVWASRNDLAAAFDLRQDFLSRALDASEPDRVLTHIHNGPRFAQELVEATLTNRLIGSAEPRPLTVTHPFSHRPLVAYVLGLPPDILWTASHPRAFVCTALCDAIPREILYRGSKQHASPIMFRTLHAIVNEELGRAAEWQLVQRGYVEAKTLTQALHRFLSHAPASSTNVLQMLAAERVLRKIMLRARRRPFGAVVAAAR